MDFIVISFKSNTQQGDPLGRVLFALAHLHVFCSTIVIHPTCVFPSLANDIYIVGPLSNVFFFFAIIGGVWSIRTFNVANKITTQPP